MELRHLRCFIGVAEALHFARAAERLHIEQSLLSRAIKEKTWVPALCARHAQNPRDARTKLFWVPPSRPFSFLALCREEEPEIEMRLSEVPPAQQIKDCTTICMTLGSRDRMRSAMASSPKPSGAIL